MANTLVKIARIDVTGTSTTEGVFTSIPQTFSDLFIVVSARSSYSATFASLGLVINATYANYGFTAIQNLGSSVNSSTSAYRFIGSQPGANATSNTFGNTEIYIPGYTTSQSKQIIVDSVAENNSSSVGQEIIAYQTTLTAPVCDIWIGDATSGLAFAPQSSFTLYGIKKS